MKYNLGNKYQQSVDLHLFLILTVVLRTNNFLSSVYVKLLLCLEFYSKFRSTGVICLQILIDKPTVYSTWASGLQTYSRIENMLHRISLSTKTFLSTLLYRHVHLTYLASQTPNLTNWLYSLRGRSSMFLLYWIMTS